MAVTRGNIIKVAIIMKETMEAKELPSTSIEAPKMKLDGVQRAAPQRLTKLSIVQRR